MSSKKPATDPKKRRTKKKTTLNKNVARSLAKNITAAEWLSVRAMLKRGATPKEISDKYAIPVSKIYAKKRFWERIDYRTDPKFAKYHSPEYIKWRNACLKRDNYSCVVCGRNKENSRVIIQVDHLKSQAFFPELKYDVNNGQVLCSYHHRRTNNYGFKAKNPIEMSNSEWLRREKMLWKTKQLKKK